MISTFKKTTTNLALVVLALTLVAGCSNPNKPTNPTKNIPNNEKSTTSNQQKNTVTNPAGPSSPADTDSIVFKNTQYSFNFTLPASWKGYTIIPGEWEGNDIASGKITETGPMINIRHPQWSTPDPRQDIPIMVFTLDQWNSLQHQEFHIGAAPISPSELGRNGSYVFALPARYNYAFPTGYEEVQKIVESSPLQTS